MSRLSKSQEWIVLNTIDKAFLILNSGDDIPVNLLISIFLSKLLFDRNFLFRGGSVGGLPLACQGIFCIVLHRKPEAGDAIW